MEFFTEKSGIYIYESSDSGSHGRLLKIIITGSLLVSIGVLALVYYLMNYSGDSSSVRIFPFIAAIFLSTDFMVFFFLRRRFGFGSSNNLKIDYMNGHVSCVSITPMFAKKVEIATGEINDVMLVKNNSIVVYGFGSSSGMYSIRITTADQILDVLKFTDIEKARRVASEFASIISRSFKDMT